VRSRDPDSQPVEAELRVRVTTYLRAHHVMTLATQGPLENGEEGDLPHAASVFYALDKRVRLVFISKGTSLHARHIEAHANPTGAPVAATVTQEYSDWRDIQGVQLWGRASVLKGRQRVSALAVYLARFPFVRAFWSDPKMARLMQEIEVIRVNPDRLAFTDNRVGAFGRQVVDLEEPQDPPRP
jgi:uncharacterized protein YhbP (UPF0306 family)